MNGIFEFEIDGKKIGFKFGTYALSEACEKENCSVDILLRRCGIPYITDGKPKADKPKLKALLHLFWGAAIHYAASNNQPTDFSPATVSDWIDELGMDKMETMIVSGLTQYTPKNSNSLKENREPVTQ